MILARTGLLFAATAAAEILGCYLVWLWLRRAQAAWLLVPAAFSLAAFAWLLTLHPGPAGRTYAAYGAVYVATAIFWMWLIEGQPADRWDLLGSIICLIGMAVIVIGPRNG
jgi:small multidrug resistance family-3 protein